MLKHHRLVRAAMTVAVFIIDLLIWGGDTDTPVGGQFPFWPALLIGLLGHSTLALFRSPWPGYVALLLLTVSTLLMPAAVCMAGFLMALFLMARHASRRASWLALSGAAIPVSVTVYNGVTYYASVTPLFVAINTGLWTAMVLAAWFAGRALARNAHRLAVERRWAAEARDEATATERLRISRDLHDSVAHSMTAIVLQVAGVRTVIKKGTPGVDVDQVLADIQSTAEQSMRELHRLLGMLRSESEVDTKRVSGMEDIGELVTTARDSGLDVTASVRGEAQPLDPSVSHAAYRVVQEGLSNAMKHGGDGARVELVTEWGQGQLTITVRSISGLAAGEPVSGGYGLLGLRERISVSGGTLQDGPTREGYLLRATLPVTGAAGHRATEVFVEE